MRKEVKRYDCTDGGARFCQGCYTMSECEFGEYVSWDDYESLLAERDALKAEQALWEPIHYEIHRRAEKQWCLSSQCDFEVTVTYEDYAAIDAALQGEQP